MKIRPKIRNAALVGALAAITATAWATNESTAADYGSMNPVAAQSAASSEGILLAETLSPNETVVAANDNAVVPVVDHGVSQPGIRIEARRLTEDERIQAAVMEKLASNARLSGKIGVESHDAVVRLSGYTSTVGQATRAGNEARSVIGVKYVQNEIRARVGGSV